MKKRLISYKVIVITLSLVVISIRNGNGQDIVPANLQAALFKKIFAFDKTLQAKGNLNIAVLGSGEEIAAAFKNAGINVRSVGGDQVPAGVSVVYVSSGIASTQQQTSSKGILSITGFPSFVEDGKVAIGIGTEGGKPKIIINLTQLKAEGHEVTADLLQIAKVIQ